MTNPDFDVEGRVAIVTGAAQGLCLTAARVVDELEARIPLGRFAQPEQMWPAAGFVAPEAAGIVLPVDGGISI